MNNLESYREERVGLCSICGDHSANRPCPMMHKRVHYIGLAEDEPCCFCHRKRIEPGKSPLKMRRSGICEECALIRLKAAGWLTFDMSTEETARMEEVYETEYQEAA